MAALRRPWVEAASRHHPLWCGKRFGGCIAPSFALHREPPSSSGMRFAVAPGSGSFYLTAISLVSPHCESRGTWNLLPYKNTENTSGASQRCWLAYPSTWSGVASRGAEVALVALGVDALFAGVGIVPSSELCLSVYKHSKGHC